MTKLQEEFCYEFCKCYNTSLAYSKVFGVSLDSARAGAYRIMKKQEIQDKIAEIRAEMLKNTCIDAARVIEETAGIAFNHDNTNKDRIAALKLLSQMLGVDQPKPKEEVIKVEVIDKQ